MTEGFSPNIRWTVLLRIFASLVEFLINDTAEVTCFDCKQTCQFGFWSIIDDSSEAENVDHSRYSLLRVKLELLWSLGGLSESNDYILTLIQEHSLWLAFSNGLARACFFLLSQYTGQFIPPWSLQSRSAYMTNLTGVRLFEVQWLCISNIIEGWRLSMNMPFIAACSYTVPLRSDLSQMCLGVWDRRGSGQLSGVCIVIHSFRYE